VKIVGQSFAYIEEEHLRKDKKMIIDATKINYFKAPERSSYDQPKSKRRTIKDDEDSGVIIDASETKKKRKKGSQ